jgi:pimeloyl-ACP methyl ester carboxylesterase
MSNWLLLRGLGREQRHWGTFPEAFSSAVGGRVVTIDLPGFGTEASRRSPVTVRGIAHDVRARFASERADESWSILGISLGGMIALEWCARHEADFERCVIVNSSARPSPRFERFNPRALLSPFASGRVAKERATLALISNRDARELDDLAVKQANFTTPGRGAVARQMVAAARFEAPARIHAPLLCLASKTDRLVSYRCTERIAAQLGGELELSAQGGHDLSLDEPAWICDRVAAWTRAHPHVHASA